MIKLHALQVDVPNFQPSFEPFLGDLDRWVGTFDCLLFLELSNGIVESGYDIEDKDEELNLGPIVLPECPEGEIIVIHLEAEPRPFHLPGFPFILMEIFERFSLFSSDVVELGETVQFLLDLTRAMHHSSLRTRVAPQLAVFLGKTALVSAELVDVELGF